MNDLETPLGKWHQQVVLSLLALGVRADKAEELAQATWQRLLEKQRNGRLDEMDLPGLAIKQARFLALDDFRRAKKRHANPIDLDLADPSQDVHATVVARGELKRVAEILSGCSPTARSVFRLFYVEGAKSAADVARQLDLSVQRVRQILCEVRKTLRAGVKEGP